MHSSRRDPARPQNALSGLECVVFSVAVDVLCHVDVRITPPPFSSGLGTGNGGVAILARMLHLSSSIVFGLLA